MEYHASIELEIRLIAGPKTGYGEELDLRLLGVQCQDAILCFAGGKEWSFTAKT
jgi:hypothetical protein